ncbi:hypothetical protein M0R04_16575 [Candidatus Dojkabacteria bacterium]|jgi:hypothetical protein|nr:hypothetical protein [Candidatus Dojkabacteria bacterium]
MYSLTKLTSGDSNVALGYASLYNNTSGLKNIAVGRSALNDNISGSSNVALGYYAGKYELGSNSLYIDNKDRTNTAGDKANSLLYGLFSDTAANQNLTVNAHLNVTGTSTLSGLVSMTNSTSTLGTATTFWSTLANIATGIFTTLTTNGTASSTSLVVSDSSITVGGKKMYGGSDSWNDRMSIPQATTTDETAKFGTCLRQGGTSVTVTQIDALIASTTQLTDFSNNGITFNINIANVMSSTSPMTLFTANQWIHGTSSVLTFTPDSTVIIPANYCYWVTFGTASTSQIQMLNINMWGYRN